MKAPSLISKSFGLHSLPHIWQMPLSLLKNRTPISNAVETKLYEQLQQLSKDTMIPISKLLDRAIELVLEEYKPAK